MAVLGVYGWSSGGALMRAVFVGGYGIFVCETE
jgi:hypothetical protein